MQKANATTACYESHAYSHFRHDRFKCMLSRVALEATTSLTSKLKRVRQYLQTELRACQDRLRVELHGCYGQGLVLDPHHAIPIGGAVALIGNGNGCRLHQTIW